MKDDHVITNIIMRSRFISAEKFVSACKHSHYRTREYVSDVGLLYANLEVLTPAIHQQLSKSSVTKFDLNKKKPFKKLHELRRYFITKNVR